MYLLGMKDEWVALGEGSGGEETLELAEETERSRVREERGVEVMTAEKCLQREEPRQWRIKGNGGGMGRWAKWRNGANVKRGERKEGKRRKNKSTTNHRKKDGHPESGDKQNRRGERGRTTRSENIHVPFGQQCAEGRKESPGSNQPIIASRLRVENHINFFCFMNASSSPLTHCHIHSHLFSSSFTIGMPSSSN